MSIDQRQLALMPGKILTEVKAYFGMDLPPRVLPLDFNLAKISGNVKASQTSSDELIQELEAFKDTPSSYFRLLLAEVKHANRCQMSIPQRLTLTRDTLRLFYPMALAQVTRYGKSGGIPEDNDRKQTLNMVVEISQIMIVSCQILFSEYYHATNYKYTKARSTVYECVSRIFELMVLKQQIRALSYQLLGEQDWQLVNTLFLVMSTYEEVEHPLPTLKKELDLGGHQGDVSIKEQFVALHMVAWFDLLRWPTHLQWVIGSYLNGVENAVQVKQVNRVVNLARNELLVFINKNLPAGRQLPDSLSEPAWILSCNGLNDAIRKDCMGLLQAKQNGTPPPPRFLRFPDNEHFIISEQLLRGLESDSGEVIVEKETFVEDLRIYVGFSEVFALLRHQKGTYASEDRLVDMLAKRSASIAEDHIATEKSVWTLLYQSEKMIRLSTQESNQSTPMNIGSLLAYGVGEDINRPGLAMISRIYRPANKVVVIDLQRISNYAEAITMTVNASEPPTRHQMKPAFLTYNKKNRGEWELIFPPQDLLPGFDKIAILRNNRKVDFDLKTRRNATTDFYLYATSITSEQLGFNEEPDYAIPQVRKTSFSGWLV
jgi:hypothetical protein